MADNLSSINIRLKSAIAVCNRHYINHVNDQSASFILDIEEKVAVIKDSLVLAMDSSTPPGISAKHLSNLARGARSLQNAFAKLSVLQPVNADGLGVT